MNMMKTYKILSILLSYPNKETMEFLPEVIPHLRSEGILDDHKIEGIELFIAYYRNLDITEWQEQYVHLFDYSRTVSLNLFEHVHGDSKSRGQAMVDLMQFYNNNGLDINRSELPDYLPAYLEFLSLQEPCKAAELIKEPGKIIDKILNTLKKADNQYQYILSAIASLSMSEPNPIPQH